MKPIERAAVHEAGHVVAAQLFGFPVELVSLEPTARSLGRTKIRLPRGGVLAAVATAAGEAAEAEARRRGTWPRAPREAPPRIMRRQLGPAPDRDALPDGLRVVLAAGEETDTAQGMARALVTRHWHRIQAVARALLEHGELTGSDVARVLGFVGAARRALGAA